MSEFELRNYPACIDDIEAAVRASEKPLTETMRKEAQALLARAREFVTEIDLVIVPEPREIAVLIDGAPLPRRLDGSALVPVGEHVLEVGAPGYQSEKRKLSLLAGSRRQISITLRAERSAPSSTSGSSAAVERATPTYKNPWLWAGLGLLVAGGVALGVVLALREDPAPRTLQGSPEIGGGIVHALRFGP